VCIEFYKKLSLIFTHGASGIRSPLPNGRNSGSETQIVKAFEALEAVLKAVTVSAAK
jgi:hypothetical protein